jgi:hypothetical protein
LLGTGGLGLRSLATGLPMSLLRTSPSAWAMEPRPTRRLILVASSAGDPINANCPGSYVEGLVHPTGDDFLPTEIQLGGRTVTAARAWTRFRQSDLDRTCFIHHGTYTNAHGNHSKVMRLMGAVRRDEMMVSMFAKQLASSFDTVQTEPVNLGAPLLTFEGRTLARLRPRSVRVALTSGTDVLAQLQSVRDAELDRIYGLLKQEGTIDQRRMLDRFAQTRTEARNISEDLLNRLDLIDGDDEEDQVRATAVLAAMNVSPVLTLRIRFGGDNHTDGDLANEVAQTMTGVDHIANLLEQLEALGLRDQVLVATLNVFGRTLVKKGTRGRDHNAHHHVMMISGAGIQPGVIGGLRPRGNDYTSTGIDSMTGVGSDEADIPYEQTLESVGKTLGRALGIDRPVLDEEISGGKVIQAALA